MSTSNSTTRSEAVLNYTFTKSDMGRKLVCLVEHVAYPTGSEDSSVALDVLCKYSFVRLRRRLGLFDTFLADKPSVKIVRVDGGSVLEDGISSLSLSCISESNPPAQVGSSRFPEEPTHLTISNQVMWSRKGPGVDSTPQYTEVSAFISSRMPHSLPPWIHQHLLRSSSSSP